MPKVLIVEDDESMAVALRDGFEYEGYSVLMAKDGAEGLRLASEASPDLLILDVMLPKMSGLDVCKKIRAAGNDLPIIMLTARGQEIDKVLGLRTGADDYVTKPFGFMELMARVEAVLRRTSGKSGVPGPCRFGDVEVDFVRYAEGRRTGRVIGTGAAVARVLHRESWGGAGPRPVTERRLGLREQLLQPDRGRACGEAEAQDRGPARGSTVHRDRARHRLQVHGLGCVATLTASDQEEGECRHVRGS